MVEYKLAVICVVPVMIVYLLTRHIIASIIIPFITIFAFGLLSDESSHGAGSFLFCIAWFTLWYLTGSSRTAVLIIALIFITLYILRYLPNEISMPHAAPKFSKCRWCNKLFKTEDLEGGYCKECRALVIAALAHNHHPAYRSPRNPRNIDE